MKLRIPKLKKSSPDITVEVLGISFPIHTNAAIYRDYLKWRGEQAQFIKEKYDNGIFPAIGEDFSLTLTPTSLGMTYVVTNNWNQEEYNLTDYGSW